MERNWSHQQRAIFGWFGQNVDMVAEALAAINSPSVQWAEAIAMSPALIGRARAGTGKSTTIVRGIDFAPEGRILLAAFNKSIQEDLARKLSNPAAEAKTLHGVGFAAVRRYWEKVNVSTGSLRAASLAEEVCGGQAPDPIKRLVAKLCTKGREMAPHATTALELIDIAYAFECEPDEEWEDAGFNVAYVAARAVEAMALAAAKKPADGIDFADMLFLPVRNHWLMPLYDLAVVDEAQDMTVTQLEIARGVCKGRICIVGDDRQAIYGFRGADSESLDRLKTELGAVELGLNVTYRCGRVITELASKIVPDIRAAENAPEGAIEGPIVIESLVSVVGPGDFVLSRTNAPLAKVAMALLRSNKRARVMGRDIGAGLRALAKKLMVGKAANSIPAFLERLSVWEEREVIRANKADRPEQVEGIRDKAETLRVIADGVTGLKELEARLENLFSDVDDSSAVVCSSVHKAKGREAEKVFILRDTLNPVPPKGVVVTAARAREEKNIEYVAITRAIKTLVWVVGK
jgi:superfamily I DNA/RNA helicase